MLNMLGGMDQMLLTILNRTFLNIYEALHVYRSGNDLQGNNIMEFYNVKRYVMDAIRGTDEMISSTGIHKFPLGATHTKAQNVNEITLTHRYRGTLHDYPKCFKNINVVKNTPPKKDGETVLR